MGLMIHSLGELPANVERDYYVYLLDYGWEEAASDAMYTNFARMAEVASRNNAAVFRGTVGHHFADEVLSWHHINGREADGVLPAILITTKHPQKFREHGWSRQQADKLLLIPLRQVCKRPALPDFEIAEEMRAGRRGAVLDALILKPNFVGLGIDINRVIDFFRRKSSSVDRS